MAMFEDLKAPPEPGKAYAFSSGSWAVHFTKGKAVTENPDAIRFLRNSPRFKEIFDVAGPENAPVEVEPKAKDTKGKQGL